MDTKKIPVIAWDTNDIENELQLRLSEESYFLEEWFDEYQKISGRTIDYYSDLQFKAWVKANKESEMELVIWEDSDFWYWEWEKLIENLQEVLDQKNPDGTWRIEGEDLGWQRLSGYKYLNCFVRNELPTRKSYGHSDAGKFLQEILPKTDCRFEIYDEGETIRINNFHHDAPTGEVYICRPCSQQEWEENS